MGDKTAGMIEEMTEEELQVLASSSPVLKRLIEEVKNEKTTGGSGYNRVYNRHHRS